MPFRHGPVATSLAALLDELESGLDDATEPFAVTASIAYVEGVLDALTALGALDPEDAQSWRRRWFDRLTQSGHATAVEASEQVRRTWRAGPAQ